MTDLGNTQNTYDIPRTHYRSSGICLARLNNTASPDSDISVYYLDYLVVSRNHQDPTITQYNGNYAHVQLGTAYVFFMTYTDYDDDAPSAGYPKVVIDAAPFSLTANVSEDLIYWDTKEYYISKADLTAGNHTYTFTPDDASSSEVESDTRYVYVHTSPTIPDYV